ncbi:hypothetical protein MBGDF03_01263 [Thermoplasmatales archaeon SCGC AB-540-F20]|nr:hypothetical protein MBGDF03_01263 [Thermoplasmatales archaeon SCGC AB-540-F20]
MKKLLVVCVIVLFLGVAIAPSINANSVKSSIDSKTETTNKRRIKGIRTIS